MNGKRMYGKQSFEHGAFQSQNFSSNLKRGKRDFPLNFLDGYGSLGSYNSSPHLENPKMPSERSFTEQSGTSNPGMTNDMGDFACHETTMKSNGAINMSALPAKPLKCVAPTHLKVEPMESPTPTFTNGHTEPKMALECSHETTMKSNGANNMIALPAQPLKCVALTHLKAEPTGTPMPPFTSGHIEPKMALDDDLVSRATMLMVELGELAKPAAQHAPFIDLSSSKISSQLTCEHTPLKMLEPPFASSKEDFELVEGKSHFEMEIKGECSDDKEETWFVSSLELNRIQLDFEHLKHIVTTRREVGKEIETLGSNLIEVGTNVMVEQQDIEVIDLDDSYPDCSQDTDESDLGNRAESDLRIGVKYNQNEEKLTKLSIVPFDEHQVVLSRKKVREVLVLFEKLYTKLLNEKKMEPKECGKHSTLVYLEAAKLLREEGKWICTKSHFGNVLGIEIGDEFRFRAELAIVGLHHHYVAGISYVVIKGDKYATSIVNSGRYENEAKSTGILIYSGEGGNPSVASTSTIVDQKLQRGNLALKNSMDAGFPIRVIHRRKTSKVSNIWGKHKDATRVYVYDGLYVVTRYWQERGRNGTLEFKFELQRISDQPNISQQRIVNSTRLSRPREHCMLDDISQGKEKMAIRAINGIDNEKPSTFMYMARMRYPQWYQPIETRGCDCTDGCSDSRPCACVARNGGEIPFNSKGYILKAKPIVYECGPFCNCPPSCMNRVSQHGSRYRLEIFKTKSTGWGVRSRDYIVSGSFICEYVGELLRDKEAEKRIGNDEYLFDIGNNQDDEPSAQRGITFLEIDSPSRRAPGMQLNSKDGFTIDAANTGNIGRFINHSCSPNLYAQDVLYDHDDRRAPHVMFFATKNIPPMRELTYDYNYKLDRVCDVDGNIKRKNCYCGSRECTGRLY